MAIDANSLAMIKQIVRVTISSIFNDKDLYRAQLYDVNDEMKKAMEKAWCNDDFIKNFNNLDNYFSACNVIGTYQASHRILDNSVLAKIPLLENDVTKNKDIKEPIYFEEIIKEICHICYRDAENLEETFNFVLFTYKLYKDKEKYLSVLTNIRNEDSNTIKNFLKVVNKEFRENYAYIEKLENFDNILDIICKQRMHFGEKKDQYVKRIKEMLNKNGS